MHHKSNIFSTSTALVTAWTIAPFLARIWGWIWKSNNVLIWIGFQEDTPPLHASSIWPLSGQISPFGKLHNLSLRFCPYIDFRFIDKHIGSIFWIRKLATYIPGMAFNSEFASVKNNGFNGKESSGVKKTWKRKSQLSAWIEQIPSWKWRGIIQ